MIAYPFLRVAEFKKAVFEKYFVFGKFSEILENIVTKFH